MKESGFGNCRQQDEFWTRGGGEIMSIYGELSMYGDIFIIDTQIHIHAQLFPPPCVHSVWKRGRGTAAEEVNNWGWES
jgi:hypothetical protein